MNILYFITTTGSASGGHYHSLNQISKEVSVGNTIGIITIGQTTSPILSTNPNYIKHIFISNLLKQIFRLNKEIQSLIISFKPNILHCFDTESLITLQLLPSTFNYHLILNKCGGPNPIRRKFLVANAIITFSIENHNWFENNARYNNYYLKLIPNRVQSVQRISDYHKSILRNDQIITFVRITRIGAHIKTLRDTISMIEYLSYRYSVRLFVIGRIQDQLIYNMFLEDVIRRKLPVTFITDDRCNNASDLLYLADFVIGTGRSCIEALSLGVPVLTPVSNGTWPVVINRENFELFFSTNFSERNLSDSASLESNESEIIRLIENKQYYTNSCITTKALFDKYFDAKMIRPKYESVYDLVCSMPLKKTELLIKNLPYLLKHILQRFWYNSQDTQKN